MLHPNSRCFSIILFLKQRRDERRNVLESDEVPKWLNIIRVKIKRLQKTSLFNYITLEQSAAGKKRVLFKLIQTCVTIHQTIFLLNIRIFRIINNYWIFVTKLSINYKHFRSTLRQLVQLNPKMKWMKTILSIILQTEHFEVQCNRHETRQQLNGVRTHCALLTLWSIGMACNIYGIPNEFPRFRYFFFSKK